MDTMEATNKVLSRIQTFDHQNASKILGYILIREHGDKDVIRLAHGPDSVLLSLIGEAKSRLGLSSNGSSATSTPSPPSPSLGPFSQRITIPNDGFHSSSPWSNGSPVFSSSKTPVFSSEEKQRWSPNEDSEDGWRPPCMFTHFKSMHGGSHTGSFNEQFLGIKAAQLYGGHNPFTYNMSNLNENPRLAPASLMISEECQRFGHCPPQECDFLDGYSDACLRQIYLTFPADSTFSEEDVSNYFSIYGPVHDVRIPYQQKRMFGFVTFVYAETVKLILAKGNPHFVCDCRVLVKPYKEKGKILEKNRKHHHHHMDIGKLSACLSTSGLDSREPYDLPFGPRMFNVSREAMIRRKLEQEAELQKAIDLHSRRLMDLQLMDMKNKENYNQFPCSSSPVIPVSCQNNSRSPNYQVTAENNGSHEASVGQENNGGNEDSGKKQCNSLDNPELHKRGLEHILPGKLVASPVKSADENLPAPTETDDSFFPTPFSNNTPTLLGTSTSVCPLFNHVT